MHKMQRWMVSNNACSHEDLTEEFTWQLAVSGTATTRREDVLLGMHNRDVILMPQDEVCKMHVLGMRDTREQGNGERGDVGWFWNVDQGEERNQQ
jgi:hypothetical protein